MTIKAYKMCKKCHASHEACELKSIQLTFGETLLGHASHEACELKSNETEPSPKKSSHASHEACELK